MADFQKAFAEVLDLEGRYSNVKADAGGETVYGISRVYNPSWEGWAIIDSIKSSKPFQQSSASLSDAVNRDPELKAAASRFYKAVYWDPLLGDLNPSQPIANEIMDIAVNIRQGKRQAVTFVQRALNGLNRDGTLWKDIQEDGIMGTETIYAIKGCIACGREANCVKLVNCIQGVYYMENSQEVFLNGLLRRVRL